ncbi:BsuBI/PstI family type II restriction endonuclease [Nocardia gipuzkoensis]
MGRRPKRLDPNDPLEAFALELRTLRDGAGRAGREKETCAAGKINRSTYYAWLAGTQLPTLDQFELVVRAWGGDVDHWLRRRRHVENLLGESVATALPQESPEAIVRPRTREQAATRSPAEQSIPFKRPLGIAEQRFTAELHAMRAAKIADARRILQMMGLDKERSNERSALTLLALARVGPQSKWSLAERVLIGTRGMIEWFRLEYAKDYQANSRETLRRSTIHQFLGAGIVISNPDDPHRSVTSPKWCYQLDASVHALLTTYEQDGFADRAKRYLAERQPTRAANVDAGEVIRKPVTLPNGVRVASGEGGHRGLVAETLTEFCGRFTPGGSVFYIGDGDVEWTYFDRTGFDAWGISKQSYRRLPAIVVYMKEKRWLILVEVCSSHGAIDDGRRQELANLFSGVAVSLFFVSAFHSRADFRRHVNNIAWNTEVWCADDPSHLISFGGGRSLAADI